MTKRESSRSRARAERWRAARCGWLVASWLLLLSVAPTFAQDTDTVTSLQFERLNRSYSGVVNEMVPVSQGGVGVRLRAPNHRLTIRGHHVDLEHKGDGLHAVTVEVEFLGLAHIVADLEVAGMTTAMEDDIVIPLQTRSVEALVRFESAPEGYFITLSDLPRSVPVAIESELGGSIVTWCDGVLGLLGFDCHPLESLFSRAIVPMPEKNSIFLLEREELTGAEQDQLDAYLSAG